MTRKRKEKDVYKTWIGYLEENHIPWKFVDCYDYRIIERLDNLSALLWHYSNFDNADLMEAQNILNIAKRKGLKVFPDFNTGWHADDKIAEAYELQRVKAPIANSWMFYDFTKCRKWLKNDAVYPLVAKLRRGSGSNNVKLLHNEREAVSYARRMFTKGYSPSQSLAYKTYSKIQSTKNMKMLIERAKKVPNWLVARKYSLGMPMEKGYCYFQEYIPNTGYDIKVAVIRDKVSYVNRYVRRGSFKASGGGELFYEKKLVPNNVIKSAFETADAIGSQCMGFDYVVNSRTGDGKIIEMSFGFDFDAIKDSGGYWDRKLIWHDDPVDVQVEIIKNLLEQKI